MQLSMPLMNLSTLVTDYKKQLVQVVESFEIMQEPIEPMEDLQPIEDISINDGELSFENVDFKYDIKTILSNVSFLIPQGEVSAFVGPSGSGKVQF